MEPGKAVVCAKGNLVRLCLCNDPLLVFDFSLLKVWKSPQPKLCMYITLIYPTVACSIVDLRSYSARPFGLLDPVGWEKGDL